MGPAGPGIVLNHGQRPTNRSVSWGACMYTDLDAIDFLKSIGAQRVYLWAFPGYWVNGAAVHMMASLARSRRVAGFIVDVEGRYPASTLADIKAAIVDEIARGLDVGLSTFPSWSGLEAFRGVATWVLIQIYGRSSMNPADFERWYQHAASILPAYRLLATFVPPTPTGQTMATPEGYNHYLSLVMPHRGQTWGTWGSGPAWMQEAIAGYRAMPWDSLVAATLGGTIFGIHDGGYFAWLAIAALAAIVVGVAIFAWWKRR